MKICSTCSTPKEETEFFFKNKLKGTLHAQCKDCKRELDRKAYNANSHNRKEKIRTTATKSFKFLKSFIQRVKKFSQCSKCGDKRWYVLDFHHIKGKDYNIGQLINRGPNIKKVKNELRKCIVLCSNCHREVHYLEREGTVTKMVKVLV